MTLIPPGGGKMSQPWRMGKYEVTQAQFTRVMGWNPSHFLPENGIEVDTKTLPADSVRWYVAVEFCNELSKLEELKPYYEIKVINRDRDELVKAEVTILGGDGYRLPTQSEWEYACRAGNGSRFGYGEKEDDLDKYGWYEKNSDGRTHKVGEKLPNGFGLYDMHGNVGEWCWGLSASALGPLERVHFWGGAWTSPVNFCTAEIHHARDAENICDDIGFRLARGPLQAKAVGKQVAVRVEPKKTDVAPAVVGPEPDFAIAPFDAKLAAKHQQVWADYVKQPVVEKSPTGVEMTLIPPGGGKLSQPWRLDKYEVTQEQFTLVMGRNRGGAPGETGTAGGEIFVGMKRSNSATS